MVMESSIEERNVHARPEHGTVTAAAWALVAARDLVQKKNALLRNFPVSGRDR
jgi:hypothetical protein